QQALAYAADGLRVYPLQERGKVPIKGTHGTLDATTDPIQITRWWHDHPDANIGLATGWASGRVVVDVDDAAGLAELEAKLGKLPPTLTVRSGRDGGFHLHFVHPSG